MMKSPHRRLSKLLASSIRWPEALPAGTGFEVPAAVQPATRAPTPYTQGKSVSRFLAERGLDERTKCSTFKQSIARSHCSNI